MMSAPVKHQSLADNRIGEATLRVSAHIGQTVIMKSVKKLLEKHRELIHSEMKKVVSHVQRPDGDWIINTVLIEDCDVPFRYKRRKKYQNLKGARVDMTYYATTETVSGIDIEVMNVVQIHRS